MELAALDIGGTHARLALARIAPGGAIDLDEPLTLATADFSGIEEAWQAFAQALGRPLPRRAAIAIAAPVTGAVLRMTNARWVVDISRLAENLGLDAVSVMNDFAAVAHAAATLPAAHFEHLAGPDLLLPDRGTVTVLGPGTGLGIAHFHRFADDSGSGYRVQATEGAHTDFAPVDSIDDRILARLRTRHGRVSVERVISGPGLVEIHAAMAAHEGRPAGKNNERTLWQTGLAGSDAAATAAVERFCLSLGSVAGDYALAHGAGAVVIAGGLGLRLRGMLPRSGFAGRFRMKGRYEAMMAAIPVKLLTHPQPGLLGAVAAFAGEHGC